MSNISKKHQELQEEEQKTYQINPNTHINQDEIIEQLSKQHNETKTHIKDNLFYKSITFTLINFFLGILMIIVFFGL